MVEMCSLLRSRLVCIARRGVPGGRPTIYSAFRPNVMNHLAPCPSAARTKLSRLYQVSLLFRASSIPSATPTTPATGDPTVSTLPPPLTRLRLSCRVEARARCHQDEAPDTHMNHSSPSTIAPHYISASLHAQQPEYTLHGAFVE